jgi:hypothetical protein
MLVPSALMVVRWVESLTKRAVMDTSGVLAFFRKNRSPESCRPYLRVRNQPA